MYHIKQKCVSFEVFSQNGNKNNNSPPWKAWKAQKKLYYSTHFAVGVGVKVGDRNDTWAGF